MRLQTGTTVGPYQVVSTLGAGGMGEVYRARDTRLNRDVALKILPVAFAADADRLMRFMREAQTLASLNHPNIAAIYGLEESNGVRGLVMELVDGEDLSAILSRGPLPLSEAVAIARQIADALEAAHDAGIIHRDLKPANVKVRPDGTVKVLDFGLAKALDATGGRSLSSGGQAGPEGPASMQPTMTSPALTAMGLILGTAAYMSPEQARGRPVDRRADIWAFGVVLFEMLSGRRAFEGDDISITLANVLKEDVPWSALPDDVPPSIRRLLRRALERDPRRRLSAIGDARLELDDLGAQAEGPARVEAPPVSRSLPWTVAAVLALGLVITLAVWAPWRATAPPVARRFLSHVGADTSLSLLAPGATAVLSPDGGTLAFTGTVGGRTRLFIRGLDELEATELPGTDGAGMPFFAPDGLTIAFFASGKLLRIGVSGGTVATVCDAESGRGGTWREDGTIIFTPRVGPATVLMQVPSSGGTPMPFAALGEGMTTQRWPQALPGGRVLYTEHASTVGFDAANLVVTSASGDQPTVVVRGGYYGRYVPSGHLVYVHQGTLHAVPFDIDRLEVVGPAVPAIEGLAVNPSTAGAQFDIAGDGTLVYLPGGSVAAAFPLEWADRAGGTSVLRVTPANWGNPTFSPDGRLLAMEISDGRQIDIFTYDWARDVLTQLTFDQADDRNPAWSPDGRRLAFVSNRGSRGSMNLYWTNADGTGGVQQLIESPDSVQQPTWHPDGRQIAFQFTSAGGSSIDLGLLTLEGDDQRGWAPGARSVILATPAVEIYPRFSPDGRWLSYMSNESGAGMDAYVRRFPGPDGLWKVSTDGANFPQWSKAGQEILFLRNREVVSVPYSTEGASFVRGAQRQWTPTVPRLRGLGGPIAIHPDGRRIALAADTDLAVVRNQLVFITNFADHLRATAPRSR